jgi:pyrimidine oxygenase
VKRLELGVFLPIGNNGFLMSRTSPQYHPTYEHNRQISVLAEEIGLDYVFSMSKWRGYGGDIEFWDHSLESMSLMTALAVATRRVGLIATVNPLLFHPAAMSKMAATADDVSGGRFGLNLITGAAMEEYAQMGVVPPDYRTRRYDYLLEWVMVLKRLWTEERVTHHGEFFRLDDCVSSPKPLQQPHLPLVCAGTSAEGLGFTARNCDYSFLGGNSIEETKEHSLHAKAIAAEVGRPLKTATTLFVVQRDTRSAAEAELQRIVDGADLTAVENVWRTMGGQGREAATKRAERLGMEGEVKVSYASRPYAGSAEDVAARILELANDGGLDSVLLIFPDYVPDLERFGEKVMPLLEGELQVGVAA